MSRFNLLTEPWIVVAAPDGSQEERSITDLFRHASEYVCLAGDTATQNFAVMRVLLAILQTVFSRYDAAGNSIVPVNDRMQQTDEVEDDEEERDEYIGILENTWRKLWDTRTFPEVLFRYLDTWKDHFYLFDDTYPFYQVTSKEMKELLPPGKKPTAIAGRFLNRTISESANKQALFSPVAGNEKKNDRKDVMKEGELARWLITFQGYTGLADKAALYPKDPAARPSRGWLFDLGGIYLEGNSLFETLLMNLVLVHSDEEYAFHKQMPCWEYSGREVAHRLIRRRPVTNDSELYTNWSRAIYVDPGLSLPGPVTIHIGKLPILDHADTFLEPMTVWRYNEVGDNKGHFTPKKHSPDQAMWRSFGLIALPDSQGDRRHQPEVLAHLARISDVVGNRHVSIRAVSMQDDNNATSWLPVDEITDLLQVNDLVISDTDREGWPIRINDAVEKTKDVISNKFRQFLNDVADIRGLSDNLRKRFIDDGLADFYQNVDGPFREWLADIQPDDSKEEKILKWYQYLEKTAISTASLLAEGGGNRDYIGIEKGGKVLNIVTAYQTFLWNVRREFSREGRVSD